MPLRIPTDAKIIRDHRLTAIRVIKTLNDRAVDGDNGLVAKVKAAMDVKGARYAESDLVMAEVRDLGAKKTINPVKLFSLVAKGKIARPGQITLAQFLACISVQKTPLKKLLGEEAIDQLSEIGPPPAPSLVTEFREGVQFDADLVASSVAELAGRLVPIKAA